MYRLLLVGMIMLSSVQVFAANEVSSLYNTRDLVQAMLWSDGVQVEALKTEKQGVSKPIKEELLVALDKLEEI